MESGLGEITGNDGSVMPTADDHRIILWLRHSNPLLRLAGRIYPSPSVRFSGEPLRDDGEILL